MDLVVEQNCKFGSVVKKLMDDCGIKVAELARQTAMPYATITRIILGHTENPTANTLLSLSEFFDVSVDYLLGRDSDKKSWLENPDIENSLDISSPKYIPLINWDSLKNWGLKKKEIFSQNISRETVAVTSKLTNNAFAFFLNKSYGDKPIFPKGSILIVDVVSEYKDSDYVVVSINKNTPTIREICEEAGKYYLRPIGLNIAPTELGPEHIVLGKVIECRIIF